MTSPVLHELTVRRPGSAEVDTTVRGDGARALREHAGRAVILMHGFANSPAAADRGYRLMLARLRDLFWPTPPDRFAEFFAFHWPGDHRLPALSQLSYATRIGPARLAGQALGRALSRLAQDREVVLVAHSLGCRVLLSALEYVLDEADRRPRISAALLLAAAVPVRDCLPPQAFAKRYPDAHFAVLHSRRDLVLFGPFPAGQLGYDAAGQAVGRHGAPAPRWDARTNTGLGHGGYWRSPQAAAAVGKTLSPYGRHVLPELPLDLWPEETGRLLPERSIPRRDLPR
jgi:hypothetical protein